MLDVMAAAEFRGSGSEARTWEETAPPAAVAAAAAAAGRRGLAGEPAGRPAGRQAGTVRRLSAHALGNLQAPGPPACAQEPAPQPPRQRGW